MPQMSGTEFLLQARQVYPDARKVLLTAYADTDVAIAGINQVQLDHYLMKPWDPPAERLYPVLDDLLGDWSASFRPPFDGIRVAGSLWSPKSHEVKDFLSRNLTPYQWIDVEQDAAVRAEVEAASPGLKRLPVVFFPDGTTLLEPSGRALAEKLGLQTTASRPFYDLVIVGGGPTGLAAAVYAGSEGLRTVHPRARDHRRAGGHERRDRELPRLPERRVGRGPGAARDGAGQALRRGGADGARGHRDPRGGALPHGDAGRRHRAGVLRAAALVRHAGAAPRGAGHRGPDGRGRLLRRRAHRGGGRARQGRADRRRRELGGPGRR